jgi:hypothetical protein
MPRHLPSWRKVPEWDITRLPCGCPDSAQRFLFDGKPTLPRVVYDKNGNAEIAVFDGEGNAHDPVAVVDRLGLHCEKHGDVRDMMN